MEHSISQSRKKKDLKDASRCIFTFLIIATLLLVFSDLLPQGIFRFSVVLLTGWLTWTFVEYFLHRFWMHNHFKNVNSKIFISHMNHHQFPQEMQVKGWHRALSFLGGFVLLYLAYSWNNYFSLFVGFYWGFISYSMMHYILHQRWAANFFPTLQRFHFHHHGKYPNKGYSFTITLWDWMFGTMPPKDAAITQKMWDFYYLPEKKT